MKNKIYIIEFETPPLRAIYFCECDAVSELEARELFSEYYPGSNIRKIKEKLP